MPSIEAAGHSRQPLTIDVNALFSNPHLRFTPCEANDRHLPGITVTANPLPTMEARRINTPPVMATEIPTADGRPAEQTFCGRIKDMVLCVIDFFKQKVKLLWNAVTGTIYSIYQGIKYVYKKVTDAIVGLIRLVANNAGRVLLTIVVIGVGTFTAVALL